MRKAFLLLAVVALAIPVMAAQIVAVDTGPLQFAGNHGSASASRDCIDYTVYDNTVNGPTAVFSQNPGAYIADELVLDMTQAPPGYNILSDLSFSVYNSSTATATLGVTSMEISIADANWSYVWDYVFSMDLGLPPGYYETIDLTGLCSLGIVLPDDIIIGLQVYGAAGTLPGQVVMNPPTIGSSTNDFYLDNTVATPPGTVNGWRWFGSTGPVANFYWGVSVCPEPTSLLLIAGGLLLRRRR